MELGKVILDSKGKIWLFYHDVEGGVSYTFCKGRSSLSDYSIDAGQAIKEFDLDIDIDDHIYLVLLNIRNEILYFKYNSHLNNWKRDVLYTPLSDEGDIKNLRVITGKPGKEGLHIFCTVSYLPEGCVLLHRCLVSGGEYKERIVSSCSDPRSNMVFDVYLNKDGRLLAAIHDNGHIDLKEFTAGKWEKRQEISVHQFSPVYTIVLEQDCLAVGTCKGIYLIPGVCGTGPCNPVPITEEDFKGKGPAIVTRKNALYISWIQLRGLRYRTSYDGGKSWSRVKEYHYMENEILQLYGLRNNFLPFLKGRRVFGTKIPYLHIPFINRPMERVRFPEEVVERMANEKDIYHLRGGGDKKNIFHSQDTLSEGKEGVSIPNESTHYDRILDLERKLDERSAAAEEEIKLLREQLEELIKEVKAVQEGLKALYSRLPNTPGNIITQQMINKHLKKDDC